ncbi:MAG: two-component sensor histidine kinase [Crocinitomix sp.]|jgi:two-component sensor histidine kinase
MKINGLTFLFCLFSLLIIGFKAHATNLDSLENVVKTTDDLAVKIETNIHIGQYYNRLGMDTAAVYLNEAIDIAKRAGNRKLAANAAMSLASTYGNILQNTDKAYTIACQARDLISYMGDTSKLYVNYCGKAEMYAGMYEIDQGNYTEAQGHFFEAIAFFEKIAAQRETLLIYNQLIFLYGIQEMLIEAEEMLTKTVLLCQENDWHYEEMIFLSNRGSIQYLQGKFIESIASAKLAEGIIYSQLDTSDYYNLGLIYSCVGSDFYELGNYDSSYFYHIKGLYCSQKTQIPSTIISTFSDLAQDCVMRGDLKEAKVYCTSMQLGIDSIENPQYQMAGLIGWISYHEAAGEFEEALEKTATLMELRESSINEGNIAEQTAQKMDFEFEKERVLSEQEIELKNENIAIEKAFNNKLIWGLFFLGALLLGFVYLFYSNFNKRKIIAKQNLTLSSTVEEKEVLLKEIHHRVKNNLQLVSSLLGLQSSSIDDAHITSIFEEGQNRVQAMAMIHQKLYQNDVASEIDFEDYLKSLTGHFNAIKATDKKVDFKIDCENIKLDIDTAIPLGLIINELFTNAFKHAFKNVELPKLSVSIKSEGDGEYIMKMSDNGRGLPPDLDWVKTKTLGLRLIRSLVKQLIGKIDYENQTDLSVFSIRFKNQFGRNLLE